MTDALSGNPVARALGVALLEFVWQGTAIAGATALVLLILRRASANARYIVGCIGLVAMLAAPVVTVAEFSSEAGVESRGRDAGAAAADRTLANIGTSPAVGVRDTSLSASISRFWHRDQLERQLPIIVTVWAIGLLLLTLQLAGSWILVERIRRVATRPLTRISEAYLRDLAASMRVTRRLRVAVSARVSVPTVIGWIRPLILIPGSALAGLSPFQLQAIISHEIAHIRRHDYVVNVLQSLVETLLFYHPGVWWISRQIRLEREHCCDDLAAEACGDRIAYARALASLEELRSDTPALALAATGGDLVTRIRRLLGRPQPVSSRPTWMVIGLTIATLSLVFAGGRVGKASTPLAPSATGVAAAIDATPPGQAGVTAPTPVTTTRPGAPARGPVATAQTAQPGAPASADRVQVMQVEGQFQSAKMQKDELALRELLADEFVGTDQNGRTRNKAESVDVFRKAEVSSLSQSVTDTRVSNGLAVVTGSMVEGNATGTDRMLFTRVWRRDDAGWWRLVSSSQFRDPRLAVAAAYSRDYAGGLTPTPPPPPPSGAVRVGGDIKEPRKIKDMKPVYPEIALAAGVQGIVIMELVVDEAGNVGSARVIRSVPLLDQAALDAVKQWQFTPTLLNGAPVQVIMTVTVNFMRQ